MAAVVLWGVGRGGTRGGPASATQEISGEDAEPKHSAAVPDVDVQKACECRVEHSRVEFGQSVSICSPIKLLRLAKVLGVS